jgi:hypothetical protein
MIVPAARSGRSEENSRKARVWPMSRRVGTGYSAGVGVVQPGQLGYLDTGHGSGVPELRTGTVQVGAGARPTGTDMFDCVGGEGALDRPNRVH